MSFTTAMIDRARKISKAATATKVEGTRVYEDQHSEWFRVRLIESQSPESLQGGKPRVVTAYELLFKLKDLTGGSVVLGADDRVEIDSGLGRRVFQVQGDPEIMRRRKGQFVGGLVTVQLVFEPGGPT